VRRAIREGLRVWLVEGEKDADALYSLGFTATTNAGGAGKWQPTYTQALAGADVVILPDNDEPGRKHATDVAARLRPVAASVRVLELPGLPPKGDVSDWIATVGTRERLERLATGAVVLGPPPRSPQARQSALVAPKPEFRLSETGNADRFVHLHGADVRFVAGQESWYVWDGRRWLRDWDREVHRRALQTVRSIDQEVSAEMDPERRGLLRKHAAKSDCERSIVNMISLARSHIDVVVLPEAFDRHSWLFNVENGTLDLRTREFRRHRRTDLLTQMAPVQFDPKAEAPQWLAFLQRIMNGSDELIGFLQRAVGYTLTGLTGE
jgi:putative DNA primase/helicase